MGEDRFWVKKIDSEHADVIDMDNGASPVGRTLPMFLASAAAKHLNGRESFDLENGGWKTGKTITHSRTEAKHDAQVYYGAPFEVEVRKGNPTRHSGGYGWHFVWWEDDPSKLMDYEKRKEVGA